MSTVSSRHSGVMSELSRLKIVSTSDHKEAPYDAYRVMCAGLRGPVDTGPLGSLLPNGAAFG